MCVIVAFSFFACTDTQNNVKLEYGFEVNSNEPMSSDFCGFKSDSNQFDIDNVSLDFYFGSSYCGDSYEDKFISIPEFDIYFTDINDNLLYLVRHVDENYVSSKYKVDFEVKENKKLKVIYNYYESIKIPKELLDGKDDRLGFRLGGIDVSSENPTYRIFNGAWIYYKLDGETVTLSSTKI